MLAALAASASPDLALPESAPTLPDRALLPLHLLEETLRVPFGEDWGGETFLYRLLTPRLSLGLSMRAWSEAICDRPSCQERAIETGVELRYQVTPGLDVGVDMGVQRTGGARPVPAILPRVHLKF